MSDLLFAKHTNAILNALPHWFKIRKESEDSIGARFLNICGLELDDARYVIDYAYRQCYIQTADINQVDFCYKTIVPMPLKVSELETVYANKDKLVYADTLKEFFGIDQHGIQDKELHTFNFYYIDYKRNIIYVRQKFNADAIHDNGKIQLTFKDGTKITAPLTPHQVWNFFDELGALVSCPRLPQEPNVQYKKRIMDVFTNKAGASRTGLINGIARELDIRRYVLWENAYRDFELKDSMIVLNSITVNETELDPSQIFLTDSGTVLLKAFEEDGKGRNKYRVSYVRGLEMHEIYNRDDIKLRNELFTVENYPKPKLKQYIDILNSESPIFWNDFHWNEHYWNQNESDISGLGLIPHMYNGSILGFKKYKR